MFWGEPRAEGHGLAWIAAPAYGGRMSSLPEPTWDTEDRTALYEGRVRLIDHRVRLSDGSQSHYEVDESVPFAVATLVLEGDTVVLTRQYRYPLNRWIYDLPGGTGERGEDPRESACREVEEELGLIPEELTPLHTYFVNPGRASWPVHIFVSRGALAPGIADLSDPSEQVRVARLSVAELDGKIASGEIVDPTIVIARAAAAIHGYLPPVIAARP